MFFEFRSICLILYVGPGLSGIEWAARGIEICAEPLPDYAGTVVWMDTEGLFSSEARPRWMEDLS